VFEIPRRRFRLTVFLALAATGVSLWFATGQLSVVANRNRESPVSVANLELGEVWAQEDFKWSIFLTNETGEKLNVEEFARSCRCAALKPSSLTILPKETAEVALTLDLRPCRPATSLYETRSFAVMIVPLIKRGDKTERREFKLRARIKNSLVVSDANVFFGEDDQVTAGGGWRPRVLRFESAVPLKAVDVWVEPACVSAVASLETDYSGVLTLVPKRELPSGRFESQVHLRAIPNAETFFPSVTLPVSGVVLDDVEVIPPLVLFRPAVVGTEMQETVVLRSRTGTPFAVRSVQPTSDLTLVEAIEGVCPESCQYRIRQRAGDTGGQSEIVDFWIAGEGNDSRRLQLRVDYVGLPEEVRP